ncbi:hypothetical protein NC652_010866 [Populus alba x Populus x berolinensis]|nr:hypothetical protein NC652_010866 [Populus alba x Populus x berolinensis]
MHDHPQDFHAAFLHVKRTGIRHQKPMECLGKSSIPNSIDHDLDLEQFHKWNIFANYELHQACIEVASDNVQRCPPNTDGRAFDSGCFMRFSDRPFFADNQTINLKPFLKTTGAPSQPTFVILMHF